jgi:uncharacterized protein (DUF433 family)
MTLNLSPEAVPLIADVDGSLRVARTRVALDTVVTAFQEGMSVEGIVEQYPVLNLADTYAVIAYYLRHRDDVDAYLREKENHSAAVRERHEQSLDPLRVRARLMARRDKKIA